MNTNPNTKFIFVTPYLDEVERIKSYCKGRHFVEPTSNNRTKSADLKRLLTRGDNIVSTHSLFSRIDTDTIDLIRMGGYTLILDEVMEVVSQESIKENDLRMLTDQGYIQIMEDGSVVAESDKPYEGRFEDILLNARMNRLIYVENTMLLWQFPVDIFGAFQNVFILTYMFDGQIQKYYYDYHGVGYQYNSVVLINGKYRLVDYTPNDDRELRDRLKGFINIYDGHLNSIGSSKYDLSVNWYRQRSRPVLKKIQNNVYNYLRNVVRGKSSDMMWTCFKDQQKALSGHGYARGFVPHNARATNRYRQRSNLAYMVNRFPRTPLVKYFGTKGIKIDEDRYALGEFIQWIWRSRIRIDQPINLYVPSSRMRNLLEDWMENQECCQVAA